MDALNDDVTLTERAPKFMHVPVCKKLNEIQCGLLPQKNVVH